MADANLESLGAHPVGRATREDGEIDADARSASLKLWTLRVGKFAALLVALVALVNSGSDLYKTVMHLPISAEGEAAAKLYQAHFGKEPLLKQPLSVKRDNLTVDMLIAIYETGDVLVRSGAHEKWIPFELPRQAALPGIATAFAQPVPSSPSVQSKTIINDPIKIDVNVLQQRQAQSTTAANEKAFTVAQAKASSSSFKPSSESFTRTFSADPGFQFTEARFEVLSGSKYQIQPITLSPDRRTATVTFRLTSGPVYDQYRAWLQGTLRANQERIQ